MNNCRILENSTVSYKNHAFRDFREQQKQCKQAKTSGLSQKINKASCNAKTLRGETRAATG